MTRSDMTLKWIDYCQSKTTDWDICKAGIEIVNDGDNHNYYAQLGMDALYRRAIEEVHGPENHPAWPCGIKPSWY